MAVRGEPRKSVESLLRSACVRVSLSVSKCRSHVARKRPWHSRSRGRLILLLKSHFQLALRSSRPFANAIHENTKGNKEIDLASLPPRLSRDRKRYCKVQSRVSPAHLDLLVAFASTSFAALCRSLLMPAELCLVVVKVPVCASLRSRARHKQRVLCKELLPAIRRAGSRARPRSPIYRRVRGEF